MAYQIEWGGKARRQVIEILSVIETENLIAAEKFAAAHFRRVALLSAVPRAAAVYERRRGYELRQVSFWTYRIFFRVPPRRRLIVISSIWHGARQEPKSRGRRSGRPPA